MCEGIMKSYIYKICCFVVVLPLRLKGIKFGKNVRIAPGYDLWGVCQKNISIGDDVGIGRRAWLQTLTSNTGRICIGARTSIGRDSVISSAESISIGSDCILSYRVSIVDHDHEFQLGKGPSKVEVDQRLPVSVGDRSFIGANSFILKGVSIGNDCIIGANSVVTADLPDGSIAVGSPAKVIGNRS